MTNTNVGSTAVLELSQVVIRADGTVEDLGTTAEVEVEVTPLLREWLGDPPVNKRSVIARALERIRERFRA